MQRDHAWHSARHSEDLEDAAAIGRRAAERAVSRLGNVKIAPGRYPVLFEPRVAGSLLGLGRVWDEVVELVTGVLTVWHNITGLFEMLRLTFRATVEWAELSTAELRVIDDMWLATGGNRFDPLTVG